MRQKRQSQARARMSFGAIRVDSENDRFPQWHSPDRVWIVSSGLPADVPLTTFSLTAWIHLCSGSLISKLIRRLLLHRFFRSHFMVPRNLRLAEPEEALALL
jgi:hypothetical protein